MADEQPETYRPRRAFSEQPTTPAGAQPDQPDPDTEPTRPLYRDEVAPAAGGPDGGAAGTGAANDPTQVRGRPVGPPSAGEETEILSRARAARAGATGSASGSGRPRSGSSGARGPRSRAGSRPGAKDRGGRPGPSGRRDRSGAADEDATTLLPRTAAGARPPRRPDDDDDLDQSGGGARRSRTVLLIVAVAVVVAIGLAIGYAAVQLTKTSATPGSVSPPPATGPSAGTPSASASGTPSPSAAAAVLTDASMVSAEAAKGIDPSRTWKVAQTLRGKSAESPQAACLGGESVEGQPTPQQTVLRLISSDGAAAPALLHEADAYSSPEEAAQAYATFARLLGGCAMQGAYLSAGKVVTNLGDQSTGVVVEVTVGSAPQFRSLVLTRTGRVIDIVDVAQPKEDISVGKVAAAAASVVKAQCSSVGGSCTADPDVQNGPPPVGGDQPGFLAAGDLPPAGKAGAGWVGNTPGGPDETLKGSGCETVDWARTAATARAARTYLVQNDTSGFGLDEVVITAKSAKDAADLADQVRDDWNSCEKRQLTASVQRPKDVAGVGARGAEINGWTTGVSQKATNGTARYRVGVAAVGRKVVFTFLNPQSGLDLTDDQFDGVTVRAAERATQVN